MRALRWPSRHERAPESALELYLSEARELFAKLSEQPDPALAEDGTAALVTAGFEELRWFDLPRACLTE